jgi:hypothetical protein
MPQKGDVILGFFTHFTGFTLFTLFLFLGLLLPIIKKIIAKQYSDQPTMYIEKIFSIMAKKNNYDINFSCSFAQLKAIAL